MQNTPESVADAVVRVGNGRGFLVQTLQGDSRVVTAAHCLPHLPPAHPASCTEERSFLELLGRLGAKPEVAAECLFVDPVRDLAVMRGPDEQLFPNESRKYEQFVSDRSTIGIGLLEEPGRGWLLTLTGTWEQCALDFDGWTGSTIRISETSPAAYALGTSGTPILDAEGRAVGVISVGTYLNPALVPNLRLEILVEFMGDKAADAVRACVRVHEKRATEIAEVLARYPTE